jgi:hypothetical protein
MIEANIWNLIQVKLRMAMRIRKEGVTTEQKWIFKCTVGFLLAFQ